MNLAKKLSDADVIVNSITPEYLVVDLPEDELPPWNIDEVDITRLYPSWESTIGPAFVLETLPKIGVGKLFRGCDAWTVFNVGYHRSSFAHVPLPKTVNVDNRVELKANTRHASADEIKPYLWVADVATVRETHYYFFLLDDYSLFGYRPLDRATFNMPNNVLAMMTFKVITESGSESSEFEVVNAGGFDLGEYYKAYYANRPPIEMLGVADV